MDNNDDTYDNSDLPELRGAPRWEGDYQIWCEPLVPDWSHYAVCAQKFIGAIGIVLARHNPLHPWNSESAILDRACAEERAMYEADREWQERRAAKQGGTRA